MTSFGSDMRRRDLLAGGAALGGLAAAGLGPTAAQAQSTTAMPQIDSAEADRLAAEFAAGAEVLSRGLALDLPALGDNPAAVPVRVHVTEPITDASWCSEIIVIADLNPGPLACRFRFTAATGARSAVRHTHRAEIRPPIVVIERVDDAVRHSGRRTCLIGNRAGRSLQLSPQHIVA